MAADGCLWHRPNRKPDLDSEVESTASRIEKSFNVELGVVL